MYPKDDPPLPAPEQRKLKRRAFTPEEDIKITQLVSIHGTKQWDLIASLIPGRNAKQCRERWRAFLSPGMVNGPWTKAEDNLLVALYQQFGPKWSKFTKHFPGRSDYNIKNRWRRYYSLLVQQHNAPPPPPEIDFDITWAVDESFSSLYDLSLEHPV